MGDEDWGKLRGKQQRDLLSPIRYPLSHSFRSQPPLAFEQRKGYPH
jgi:hypothetical protein